MHDKANKSASISIIVPDTLMAIANGRLISKAKNTDTKITYKWVV